ncbi:DUF4179 domain-containing protein [Lysinibacillus sp. NPDC056185]|uniref:DUF4179 domain-containing protein n=1 Tax=Lysinibacillus sp. NPDC056185 TaxID=3345739 RepID=UPI0039EF875F
MSELFKLFNRAKIQTEQYDETQLSDLEIARIKKRLNPKLKTKTSKKKKITFLSGVGVALLAVTIAINSPNALAKLPIIGNFIEQYINHPDVNDDMYTTYKNIIGQTKENKYGTLTLNEVMLDQGELFIKTTYHSNKPVPNSEYLQVNKHLPDTDYLPLFPEIKLDGKEVESGGGGAGNDKIDDQTFVIYSKISIPNIELSKPHEIQFSFNTLNDKINDPWEFNFTATGEAIAAKTTETMINQSFSLPNGQKVIVEKITQSPVSLILYYHMFPSPDKTMDYDVLFRLYDQNNNQLGQSSSQTMLENSSLRFQKENMEPITNITLVPHSINVKSGVPDKDVVKVFHEYTITTQLNK